MKRYLVAAGALLLSTSVLGLSAGAQTTDAQSADKSIYASKLASVDKAPLAAKFDMVPDSKVETASIDTTAVDKVETASLDTTPVDETTGVGGPEEMAIATTALDLTPRLATHNYPACDPGPGDDNCIQLYEPGVRAQLASWNQPTGGLADGSATTAMGGPYEPVVADQTDVAMNGDGMVDTTAGKKTPEVELASHVEHQGVGGPIEAQSGYPPCSPGPGDDRCIQLYEPGVTGAGN